MLIISLYHSDSSKKRVPFKTLCSGTCTWLSHYNLSQTVVWREIQFFLERKYQNYSCTPRLDIFMLCAVYMSALMIAQLCKFCEYSMITLTPRAHLLKGRLKKKTLIPGKILPQLLSFERIFQMIFSFSLRPSHYQIVDKRNELNLVFILSLND